MFNIVSRLQKRIADYLITADTENFSFTWNNCDATVILALPNKNIVFSEAVKKGEIAPKILKTPTDIFDVVSQGYLSPAFQHFPLLHKC